MSTLYLIRRPGDPTIIADANTLRCAQLAKRTLEAEMDCKLIVYGPEHQTYQRALEALR